MERFLLVFLVAHMIPPFPTPCITWKVLWGSTGASGDADGVWVATSWYQAAKNTKPCVTPKIMWVFFTKKPVYTVFKPRFKPRLFFYVVFSVKKEKTIHGKTWINTYRLTTKPQKSWGPVLSSRLAEPSGLVLTAERLVFVADSGNGKAPRETLLIPRSQVVLLWFIIGDFI